MSNFNSKMTGYEILERKVLDSEKTLKEGNSIIEVETLPISNISRKTFYKTSEGIFYYDGEWHNVSEGGSDLSKIDALDTSYSQKVVDLDIYNDGIRFEDKFSLMDEDQNDIVMGEYMGRIPILPGKNITFEKDNTNKVIKINATGGSGDVSSWNDLEDKPFYEKNSRTWVGGDVPLDKTVPNLCAGSFGLVAGVIKPENFGNYEVEIDFTNTESGTVVTRESHLLSEFTVEELGGNGYLLTLDHDICVVRALILTDYDSFGGFYSASFSENGTYLSNCSEEKQDGSTYYTNYSNGYGLYNVVSEVKCIDEKFIPDTIARKGEGGSTAIIDVDTLPTENINANAFYRVKTETLGHYMLTEEGINVMDGKPVEVITVETLPATGKPLMVIDYEAETVTATLYVRTSDSTVHFYIDETVSAMLEAPVGWSDAGAIGFPYEIVSSPEEVSGTAIAFVETTNYKYPLYIYAIDEWVEVKSDYSDFSDLGGVGACTCVIPTKVSELENDKGYITSHDIIFDGTYNATTNKAATVSTVRNATPNLDVVGSEGLKYTLYDDYAVCGNSNYQGGIGECTDTDIIIGELICGLPVKEISKSAFNRLTTIKGVIIPGSVITIGDWAFELCTELTSVKIGNGVKEIGYCAFDGCYKLSILEMSDSVESIGDSAFANAYGLTTIPIGKGVKSIGEYAFNQCSHATSVNIPVSVNSIGDKAFVSCHKILDVYYEGTEEEWGSITIGTGNDYLTNATIHYNSEV